MALQASLINRATHGGDGGDIWKGFVTAPDAPEGFTLRTAFSASDNPTGAETMLEMWRAGSSEPPHSHPGDDMTIVVEGEMVIQFYALRGGALEKEDALVLTAGQTGYIAANRIHDATYVKECKIVYVHSRGFGFTAH